MARKKLPSTHVGPDWFLVEWMRFYKKSQRKIAEAIGVSESTMSDICNGKTSYYRALVNDLASALNIHPYELLMHPDAAHHLRSLQNTGLQIAEDTKRGYLPPPSEPAKKTGTDN